MSAQFPKGRLNQLAQRKLAQLGLPAVALGDQLQGEILSHRRKLTHPLTQQILGGFRFVVEGHDQLRFVGPSLLVPLAPISFGELSDIDQLMAILDSAIQNRVLALNDVGRRLKRVGLDLELDRERGEYVGRTELGAGMLELEADERGLRVLELAARGTGHSISFDLAPVDLRSLPEGDELKLMLAELVEEAIRKEAEAAKHDEPNLSGDVIELDLGSLPPAAPAKPKAALAPVATTSRAAPSAPVAVQPPSLAPPRGALALGLLHARFGANATINSPAVKVSVELNIDGQPVRFEAEQESGTRFKARAVRASGETWSGAIELESFPGVERFVAGLLGRREPAPELASLLEAFALPRPGEIWSLRVLIEQETADEVRYVPLNANGKPYGAARVLPRAHFHAVFEPDPRGHRILVQVLAVDARGVQYAGLNPARTQLGEVKLLPVPAFMSQFIQGY